MSAVRDRFAPFVLGLLVVMLGAVLACPKTSNLIVVGPAFCSLPNRQTTSYVTVDLSLPSGVVTPYIVVCAGDTISWRAASGEFMVSVPADSGDTPLNATSFQSASSMVMATVQPQSDLPNPGDSHFFAYTVSPSASSGGGSGAPGGGGTPQDPGIIIMK